MNDLIARVRDPGRFTSDAIWAWYEVHRQEIDRPNDGKRVVWTCTCAVRRCKHLHALWDGHVWEGRIPTDVGVLTRPHFLVELTPLGDELLRPRWAALTLQKTV